MLNHKIHAPTLPPVFASTDWIAHNISMQEKRALLKGEKPVIGLLYQPKIVTSPAVQVEGRRSVHWKVIIKDALCLVGAVAVFGFMAFAGSAVFFAGPGL